MDYGLWLTCIVTSATKWLEGNVRFLLQHQQISVEPLRKSDCIQLLKRNLFVSLFQRLIIAQSSVFYPSIIMNRQLSWSLVEICFYFSLRLFLSIARFPFGLNNGRWWMLERKTIHSFTNKELKREEKRKWGRRRFRWSLSIKYWAFKTSFRT